MSKPDFIPTLFKADKNKAAKKLQHLGYSPKRTPADFRERLYRAFYTPFLPNRVEHKTYKAETVPYDELIPTVYIKNRCIFYVHGGSFVAGSAVCWRPFCASLANACSARAFLPEYRLAPSFAFPSSVEDIQCAFRDIYARETVASRVNGCAPPEFIIGADGSGASPALAFVFNLKEHIRASIKQIVLFSPWLDLTQNASAFAQKRSRDKILSAAGIRASADLYTYAANMKNPMVSPMYGERENFNKFPPVYMQMGGTEILLEDAKKFRDKLESMQIECVLDVEEGMMHMFQMADEFLEESYLAVERIGKFVKTRCEFAPDSDAEPDAQ
jgi:acetyl esterase/lipase